VPDAPANEAPYRLIDDVQFGVDVTAGSNVAPVHAFHSF
jgi:hypothetical protein